MNAVNRMKIMVVDDNVTNLNLVRMALDETYEVTPVLTGEKALTLLRRVMPDLVLLDIEMPGMDGFAVIEKMKQAGSGSEHIPVIFVTAKDDSGTELEGLELGAVDYIAKPFSFPLLRKRVALHLALVQQSKELQHYSQNLEKMVEEKTKVITELQYAIVHVLSDMVERRDGSTGAHLTRTQAYLRILLEAARHENVYPEELMELDTEMLIQASQLHDVGKMSIPDGILLKCGRLTEAEFKIMKTHTLIGEEAIEYAMQSVQEKKFLKLAATIAGFHHERWNGEGYPRGMKAFDIPIEARLMAIVDVYDALVSERPYKGAFPHTKAVEMIQKDSGTYFDPVLTQCFLKAADRFAQVMQAHCDAPQSVGQIMR